MRLLPPICQVSWISNVYKDVWDSIGSGEEDDGCGRAAAGCSKQNACSPIAYANHPATSGKSEESPGKCTTERYSISLWMRYQNFEDELEGLGARDMSGVSTAHQKGVKHTDRLE